MVRKYTTDEERRVVRREQHRRWWAKNKHRWRTYQNEYNKRYKRENKARLAELNRWQAIYSKYGITKEQYDAILTAQGGRCAVCRTDQPGNKSGVFVVDHDHETKKVRGLLCENCNVGLGRFKDRPDVMRSAASYIERNVMSGLIIGLCANAGVGKDTAADFLVQDHGFIKMSLADEMKRFCKQVFLFTDEQLWGPSSARNAEDARFNQTDWQAWDDAFDRMELHGIPWCQKLFGGDPDSRAMAELATWFCELEAKFGPCSGSKACLSPRVALQTIGTEFGRKLDETVWYRVTIDIAKKALTGPYRYSREAGLVEDQEGWGQWWQNPKGVVIPDCRFKNETQAVRDARGLVVRLKRDTGAKAGTVGVQGHQSEMEQLSIPDTEFDYVVEVTDGLDAYRAQMTTLVFDIQLMDAFRDVLPKPKRTRRLQGQGCAPLDGEDYDLSLIRAKGAPLNPVTQEETP